jgi:hypothetical protein
LQSTDPSCAGERSVIRVGFVVKRFVQVLAIAFATLTFVYVLRGQAAIEAAKEAGIWSLIAATIFAGTVVYNQRTKKDCKLCIDDTADTKSSH